MSSVVFPAMKMDQGVGCGAPCRGERGGGREGEGRGRGGRERDEGRGEEEGSAHEEETSEGFRGSECMMDGTGVDLQRERGQLVG